MAPTKNATKNVAKGGAKPSKKGLLRLPPRPPPIDLGMLQEADCRTAVLHLTNLAARFLACPPDSKDPAAERTLAKVLTLLLRDWHLRAEQEWRSVLSHIVDSAAKVFDRYSKDDTLTSVDLQEALIKLLSDWDIDLTKRLTPEKLEKFLDDLVEDDRAQIAIQGPLQCAADVVGPAVLGITGRQVFNWRKGRSKTSLAFGVEWSDEMTVIARRLIHRPSQE